MARRTDSWRRRDTALRASNMVPIHGRIRGARRIVATCVAPRAREDGRGHGHGHKYESVRGRAARSRGGRNIEARIRFADLLSANECGTSVVRQQC